MSVLSRLNTDTVGSVCEYLTRSDLTSIQKVSRNEKKIFTATLAELKNVQMGEIISFLQFFFPTISESNPESYEQENLTGSDKKNVSLLLDYHRRLSVENISWEEFCSQRKVISSLVGRVVYFCSNRYPLKPLPPINLAPFSLLRSVIQSEYEKGRERHQKMHGGILAVEANCLEAFATGDWEKTKSLLVGVPDKQIQCRILKKISGVLLPQGSHRQLLTVIDELGELSADHKWELHFEMIQYFMHRLHEGSEVIAPLCDVVRAALEKVAFLEEEVSLEIRKGLKGVCKELVDCQKIEGFVGYAKSQKLDGVVAWMTLFHAQDVYVMGDWRAAFILANQELRGEFSKIFIDFVTRKNRRAGNREVVEREVLPFIQSLPKNRCFLSFFLKGMIEGYLSDCYRDYEVRANKMINLANQIPDVPIQSQVQHEISNFCIEYGLIDQACANAEVILEDSVQMLVFRDISYAFRARKNDDLSLKYALLIREDAIRIPLLCHLFTEVMRDQEIEAPTRQALIIAEWIIDEENRLSVLEELMTTLLNEFGVHLEGIHRVTDVIHSIQGSLLKDYCFWALSNSIQNLCPQLADQFDVKVLISNPVIKLNIK